MPAGGGLVNAPDQARDKAMNTGRYMVAVRHRGFVDRFLLHDAKPDHQLKFTADSLGDAALFFDAATAQAVADAFEAAYAQHGYRFAVLREVLKPALVIDRPSADWRRWWEHYPFGVVWPI
jgi:hypothetical protein